MELFILTFTKEILPFAATWMNLENTRVTGKGRRRREGKKKEKEEKVVVVVVVLLKVRKTTF